MNTKQKMIMTLCSIVAAASVMPYFLESNNTLLEQTDIPVSRTVFILSIVMQSAVFLTIAVWTGNYFANRTGMNPFKSPSLHVVFNSLFIGVATGLTILAVDYLFHINNVTPNFFTIGKISSWKSFIACFYGGIVEEILLRFFLLGILLFLLYKSFRGKFRNIATTIAVAITALVFATGHIPAMQLQTTLTPIIITRVIILNSIGGLIFGYLYIKNGLLPAMIAHFSADFMLIFLFPILYF